MRSLLAYWAGGAGTPPGAANAGYKSLLAHWAGGACGVTPADVKGYRSLLAFWAGGACAGVAPEPDTPDALENYSGRRRHPGYRRVPDKPRPERLNFFDPNPVEQRKTAPVPVEQEVPYVQLIPAFKIAQEPPREVPFGKSVRFGLKPADEFEDVFGDLELLALLSM